MDLDFNQDDIDFRNEVRDFIKVSYTQEMKDELARSKNGSASKELHLLNGKSHYMKKAGLLQIGLKSMVVQVLQQHKNIFLRQRWLMQVHREQFHLVFQW